MKSLWVVDRNVSTEEPMQEFKSTVVLRYVKGVSEVLHRCLQQQGLRTVFKLDTTLRSHLVLTKDAPEPTKQGSVIYIRNHVNAAKYILRKQGERSMQERIKEHDRDIRFKLLVHKTLQFQNTQGIFPFGTKSSLLIVTLTGTHVGSRRLSI